MLTLNKKILLIFFAFIVLLGFMSNNSYSIVHQSKEFYVNDTANIIDKNTEDYIIDINKKLFDKTGAQIVVVTVDNLEGQSIEEYSTELFREYGIGDKEKNNGVLYIISVKDRKTRIEVGYGLEGRLTDGKTGRILDNYVVPYFKDNNWNDGIRNGFNAILDEVCQEYNITIDGLESATDIVRYEDIKLSTAIIVCFFCLILRAFLYKAPLIKWILACITTMVSTIIDCIILHSFVAVTFFFTNLLAAFIGTIAIDLFKCIDFGSSGGGGYGYGGGSGSGGSFGGGGSSGGGGGRF